MKRIFSFFLTILLLACMLAGCRTSVGDATTPETTTEPTANVDVIQIPSDEVEVTVPKETLAVGEGESDIAIAATGGVRITYSGNVSSARYITSRDQLPDYPELQGYDDAYFQEHGLLLVMETVTSGGMEVKIDGVSLDGDSAVVRLSHGAAGEMGTAVMTTWLLWAEVEAGLTYTWSVGNPAVESDAQRY